jgi:hypothetical protein
MPILPQDKVLTEQQFAPDMVPDALPPVSFPGGVPDSEHPLFLKSIQGQSQ